jgi:hypothetical protein
MGTAQHDHGRGNCCGHASQCTSEAMNASPLTGLTLQDDAARHSPHSRVAAA